MKKRYLTLILSLILCFIMVSPVLADDNTTTAAPTLIAESAIAVDLDTNEIIYAKNIDEKRQPASITKLMTALLLAENKKQSDMLTYPAEALKEAPYSYGLNVHPVTPEDTFTAKDAMDILLLYSGNDSAYMIAKNVGGSIENFVKMMNEKAKKLGMTGTNFVTVNGLDDDTNDHYTTAFDLTLLMKAAYDNPWIKETLAKKTSDVHSTNGPTAIIENRNKLVGIDGNVGGKTGYTDKAGRCLVSIYKRNNRNIATVVLKSEYNLPEDTKVFEDMEALVNYAFSAKPVAYVKKNSNVQSLTVNYKVFPFIGPVKTIKIPVTLHEDINMYDSGLKPDLKYSVNSSSVWKLNSSKPIGTVKVSLKNYSKDYNLYPTISKFEIFKSNIAYYAIALLVLIIIISLIIIICRSIKRRRRRNRRMFR